MPTGPNCTHVTLIANAHDIVGLRKLLRASGLEMTLSANLEELESGHFVCAPHNDNAIAYLFGSEIEDAIKGVRDWNIAKVKLVPIIARINALASTLDPNFGGILPIGGLIKIPQGPNVTFSYDVQAKTKTVSTLGRHEKQIGSLADRWNLAASDDTISLVMESFLEPPTWNAIGACFENIEYSIGAGRAKLHKHDLMNAEQEKEFGKAANNRIDRQTGTRHGKSEKNQKFSPKEVANLMNIREARELHRQVVSRFLDLKTGHRTAYEPIDSMNEQLRFGLDIFQSQI